MDNNSYYRLFLLFFIGLSLYTEATFGSTSKTSEARVKCIEGERQALLKLKQGLVDDYAILSSWSNGEDNKECCKWWGVKCSNRTGHVVALDLGGSSLTGVVPHQLGNLTSLQTLDLGFNDGLTANNLEWLSQLHLLRQLDLSVVYLNVTNWVQVIVNLPFLEELHLRGCWFYHPIPSSFLLPNSSSESLSILDLYDNGLISSSLYPWLFNISKNLVSIDLRFNSLEGPIPVAFGEMISLEDMDLGHNIFEGGIPKYFQNLTHLRSLSLSFNHNLSEPFPELLQKLSKGAEKSLESLDFFENQFYGPLTDLTRFSSLKEQHLGGNQLNGSFLENFLLPPSLLYLDLSNNQITGNLLIKSSLQISGFSSLEVAIP